MKKYKLNTDKKKEPTPAQTKKYKDFSKVAHNYQRLTKRPKKPLYRDPKLFILILLLGLIFMLVFMETEKEENKSKEVETEQLD